MGAIVAFGFVLALMALALHALRRFAPGGAVGRSALPLEVVQRVALGPKQGIAVVRIGDRLLAVSLGEGGVNPLLELGDEERALIASSAVAPVRLALPSKTRFQELLRTATRSAALLLFAVAIAALLDAAPAHAQAAADAAAVGQADAMITKLAPQVDVRVGQGSEGLRLSGTVGVVVMMGLLTLLPTLLLMMTGFTRILIVLHFLRQALGTQSAPPAHLMAGLALLLTGFVMAPTFSEVNRTALKPWMDGEIQQGEMLLTASGPFREFMLNQTRERDLASFMEMSTTPAVDSVDQVPLVVLISAFVTSELRTAFQIGFALFLPFIVIDVVVASVLMSMGMFMLPPPMIALPFKILLFVLVDGWTLVVQGLVSSFR